MPKATIVFEFDDEQDQKELLRSLKKYHEITWNNDTKKAMIAVINKDNVVLVSKSIDVPAKPFRV